MKIKTKIEVEINENKYTIENDLYKLESILTVLNEFNDFSDYKPNKQTINTLFLLLEKLNNEKIDYHIKQYSERQVDEDFEIELDKSYDLTGENDFLEGIAIEDNEIIIYEYYKHIGVVRFDKELLKTEKFIPLVKKLYQKQKKEKENEN